MNYIDNVNSQFNTICLYILSLSDNEIKSANLVMKYAWRTRANSECK